MPKKKKHKTANRGTAEFPDEVFTTQEVTRLARVTQRQLQWWSERGFISPQRDGRRRHYRTSDVIEIIVMSELRSKGLGLQKARSALRSLRNYLDQSLRNAHESSSDLYFVTDSKSFHFEHRPDVVVDLFTKARVPMFLVCVSDHLKRLAEEKPQRTGENQLQLFG